MNFVILSEKSWNSGLRAELEKVTEHNWTHISDKQLFSLAKLQEIAPEKIFIPHWSYIIPEEIYSQYDCVIFHMTDLPYGRGGSPLQNLIEAGHKETKLTALKAGAEVDAGDIYLKKDLILSGRAEDIYKRVNDLALEMILEIIEKNIIPVPQTGEPTYFKRRTPEQSNLKELVSIEKIYDYIRMLDAEGYPKAFLETEGARFEFSDAIINDEKTIKASVRITKK